MSHLTSCESPRVPARRTPMTSGAREVSSNIPRWINTISARILQCPNLPHLHLHSQLRITLAPSERIKNWGPFFRPEAASGLIRVWEGRLQVGLIRNCGFFLSIRQIRARGIFRIHSRVGI